MESVYNFNIIDEYNRFNQQETVHPLVSVIDFSTADRRTGSKMYFNLYCIFLKEVKCGDLKYGKQTYDYQKGTLVFISPGQVVDVLNKTEEYQPMGHGLVFHPDLLLGTSLGKAIHNYNFFQYNSNEALHISKKEQDIVFDCFNKINFELQQGVDKHSKKLITTNIELFLDYCKRFYDRQFITREHINSNVVANFETLLLNYLNSGKPKEIGFPMVQYFADQLNFSANYFGDLIKKETGHTAQDYIQKNVIGVAKERIFDVDKSISEIAYELGFKYPQHFTRLFKKRVGMSPKVYRNLN
ncbi:helix-turn-helix domain-containing protein [Zunongwangia atlantica]|uniref:DNA-binding domain-containing protein n=1 Tax=Zunongwangia atlantica 22II14-10F7 TaxID=1185767 RepID=A0A1Y1SXW3_9FLAO|nr:helix-turn-helix transcriptional regulator [Zunongwangia atlantica]ORL43588.1 DNA-binding domain-containing protein [Zunongwangia atlantica 22II14-10F7]